MILTAAVPVKAPGVSELEGTLLFHQSDGFSVQKNGNDSDMYQY